MLILKLKYYGIITTIWDSEDISEKEKIENGCGWFAAYIFRVYLIFLIKEKINR
tara:strand:+ start:328 stop:489 length:162 start_codon:yes stop_codon:yes gene_type:complete